MVNVPTTYSIGGGSFPAAAYDPPETIANTIPLGKTPMAVEPDLNYRGVEPAASTVKRCSACEDLGLRIRLHELHRNLRTRYLHEGNVSDREWNRTRTRRASH